MLSHFSCIRLFVTHWTAARQAPLPMGFSRQEYYSGLPCPPPGDLPDRRTKPASTHWQAGSLTLAPPRKPMWPHGLFHSGHGILQARMLEWVVFPFSQPRDQTQVFCIAGGFFTIWGSALFKELGRKKTSIVWSLYHRELTSQETVDGTHVLTWKVSHCLKPSPCKPASISIDNNSKMLLLKHNSSKMTVTIIVSIISISYWALGHDLGTLHTLFCFIYYTY